MIRATVFSLLVFVALTFLPLAVAASTPWVNKKVSRRFDVTKHVVKVLTDITVIPSGETNDYLLPISKNVSDHLAFMVVSVDGNALVASRVTPRPSMSTEKFDMFSIKFDDMKKDKTMKFRVKQLFSNVLEPYPKRITQLENQRVLFYANAYFSSPYETITQTTQVKAGSQVESFSEVIPAEKSKGLIKYGPYKSMAPYSYAKLRVHFVNNHPFATFTSAEREIEVSHWGNVAIEEVYDLAHMGATLTGGFSRVDYTKRRALDPHFQGIVATLPSTARDAYFRDIIGNISSSNFHSTFTESKLELAMRFPLYGGWKTNFYMGYNLPISGFVESNTDGRYQLTVDLSTPFVAINTEELLVRVILPEGAVDIEVDTGGVEMDGPVYDRRFTYLDSSGMGRPVIELKKTNVVNEHNSKLTITYSFNSALLLREPIMLIGLFGVFFLIAIVGLRIELTLNPKPKTL